MTSSDHNQVNDESVGRPPAGSLHHAMQLLLYFTTDRQQWGPRELAGASGFSKSTVGRILLTLAEMGFLDRTVDGRYQVGYQLHRVGALYRRQGDLAAAARPVMQAIAGEVNETVTLCKFQGGKLFVMEKAECTHPIRHVLTLGEEYFAHSGAAGKAILSQLPPDELAVILDRHGLPQVTPNTITDRDRLIEDLALARRRGVAFSRGERNPGAVGIASAILDERGRPIGSLNITIPEFRYQEADSPRFSTLVQEGADRISRLCGYDGPPLESNTSMRRAHR